MVFWIVDVFLVEREGEELGLSVPHELIGRHVPQVSVSGSFWRLWAVAIEQHVVGTFQGSFRRMPLVDLNV